MTKKTLHMETCNELVNILFVSHAETDPENDYIVFMIFKSLKLIKKYGCASNILLCLEQTIQLNINTRNIRNIKKII